MSIDNIIPPAIVRQEELPAGVYASRFGYHPCSYKTYLKICFIRYCYWQSVKRFADWRRWANKLPDNRVRRIRRANGELNFVTIPEPNITEIVKIFKPMLLCWIGGTIGFGYKEVDKNRWKNRKTRLNPHWIDTIRRAKMPSSEVHHVAPFNDSFVAYIDELFEKLGPLFPIQFNKWKTKLAEAKR